MCKPYDTCENCIYSEEVQKYQYNGITRGYGTTYFTPIMALECHYNPPVANVGWPEVKKNSWCRLFDNGEN